MKRVYPARIACVALCVLGLSLLLRPAALPSPGQTPAPEPKSETGARMLRCDFYEEKDFLAAVAQAQPYALDGPLLCATVPHHLLASGMIASVLATARSSRPDVETVVIVAPIHKEKRSALATTLADWQTPTGILPTDRSVAMSFARELHAETDDALLQEDHSASALIPFVKTYFPEASVACLLISGNAGRDVPARIAELLADTSREKSCFFLFSVDFSHYLNPEDTDLRDEQTRRAVMSGDTAAIRNMTNDNMDAPAVVCSFLHTTGQLGGEVFELDHANSLALANLPYNHPSFAGGLTSYFIFGGCAKAS